MVRLIEMDDAGTGKRSKTRRRLTDAALRLMSAQGIVATSVSEIASEAEVANGTFYLHFKNKSEIVSAVCRGVTLAMHTEMSGKSFAITDAVLRVKFATHQFIEIAAAEPVWGRLLLRAFEEFDAIRDDLSRYLRADIALGIEQGHFIEVPDEFTMDCLLAILRTGVAGRLSSDDVDISRRAGDYMLRILGPPISEDGGLR